MIMVSKEVEIIFVSEAEQSLAIYIPFLNMFLQIINVHIIKMVYILSFQNIGNTKNEY